MLLESLILVRADADSHQPVRIEKLLRATTRYETMIADTKAT